MNKKIILLITLLLLTGCKISNSSKTIYEYYVTIDDVDIKVNRLFYLVDTSLGKYNNYEYIKDTGHYNGGWVKSTNWQYQGEPVESLKKAIAGDVIVYDGHVAIYDGNGKIVEARGTAYGITDDRAADAKEIIAIRRFPKINDN